MENKAALRAGVPAPAFAAQTWDGQRIVLSNYRNRRVWLAFFRHVNCPLCNIRIHEMRDKYAHVAADTLQILAVFQSPAARFAGSKAGLQSWYPLISDPKEEMYGLYGLTTSIAGALNPANLPLFAHAFVHNIGSFKTIDGSVTRVPGDFLIGSDGIILDAYYGRKIGNHIPYARVDAFMGSKTKL